MELHDLSGLRIFDHRFTLDEVPVPESHLPPECEPVEALLRLLLEVVPLDVKLSGEGNPPGALPAHVPRVVGGLQLFHLPLGVVRHHHLQGLQHAHHPGGRVVQVVPDGVFELSDVHTAVGLRHTDHLAEVPDRLGRHAPAAEPGDGGHPGVVPPLHVLLLHETEELPLAQHRVVQVQPGHLVLMGPGLLEAHLLQQPVVDLPVVLELQRADGVGDVLEGVGETVGEVVEGVDAPRIAPAIVLGVTDPVEDRVPHDHVGMSHVDLGPEDEGPVLELPGLHPPEEVEVLLRGAIPIWALRPGPGDRSPTLPDLLLALLVDVGLPLLDEDLCALVQLLEVVRGEVEVLPPVVAQPTHRVLDRMDVLHVLGERIRVVETEMTHATILGRESEVQDYGLRVSDMEIAVGLGRKAGLDATAVAAVLLMPGHDGPDEVDSRGALTPIFMVHADGLPFRLVSYPNRRPFWGRFRRR